MHIAIIANSSWNLVHFRAALISALQAEGHTVIAIAPRDRSTAQLKMMGCIYRSVEVNPRGKNIYQEFKTFIKLLSIFRSEPKPDYVLNFTIKPVIYGSLAAYWCKISTINTITGLGTVFISNGIFSIFIGYLYRLAHRRVNRVFFQNEDDYTLVVEQKRLIRRSQAALIPGSGIDVNRFSFVPPVDRQPFVFLMIGRLFWEKGVGEFVAAAEEIRGQRSDCNFELVGRLETGQPGAVDQKTLDDWKDCGIISYRGFVENIEEVISTADCVVLPSYREGLPMVLLEASAMGRVIIGSDVPGCRSVVVDGENGFLCEARSVRSLVDAMRRVLTLTTEERFVIGQNGRRIVETRFSKEKVVDTYMESIRA